MTTKHICIRHDGMITIIPDAVSIYTQEPCEKNKASLVSVIRNNGRKFTVDRATEVSSLYSKEVTQE